VREAYSLLKQSIIHVEKDDVEIEEEEEADEKAAKAEPTPMEEDEDEPTPVPTQSSPTRRQQSAEPLVPSSAPAKPKKKKIVITYDRYMAISNLITLHLQDIERSTGEGVPRSDVEQWYMEQREVDLNTVAEYDEEKELIKKVLTKLVKEKQLLELRGEMPETMDSGAETQAQDDENTILMGEFYSPLSLMTDRDRQCILMCRSLAFVMVKGLQSGVMQYGSTCPS
jgi:DNA replication licensing factor MCM6